MAKDADTPDDVAEQHADGLAEAAWEAYWHGTIREQGGSPEFDIDAESALWLNSALTPPLEPYDWADGEELEGERLTYVPGQGWVVGEDEEGAL